MAAKLFFYYLDGVSEICLCLRRGFADERKGVVIQMNKQQYLSQLREALEGNIPLNDIDEHIQFYDAYFRDSGKTQEEVCEELGDPRLIARTIIDSFTASKGPMADFYTEQARSEYSSYERGEQNGGQASEQWYDKLLRGVLFGVIVIIVATAMIFLLRVAIYVVVPIMIFVLLAKLVTDLFRRY